jgi:hypothetical protein
MNRLYRGQWSATDAGMYMLPEKFLIGAQTVAVGLDSYRMGAVLTMLIAIRPIHIGVIRASLE